MPHKDEGMFIVGLLILVTGLYAFGIFQPFYSITDINNWIAEGTPSVSYASVIDSQSRTFRCDLGAGGAFPQQGILVRIDCQGNSCINDPRVSSFVNYGIDSQKSTVQHVVNGVPGGIATPIVQFHAEYDYVNFGGGKVYWIGITHPSGSPNIGDQQCSVKYHVEFAQGPVVLPPPAVPSPVIPPSPPSLPPPAIDITPEQWIIIGILGALILAFILKR